MPNEIIKNQDSSPEDIEEVKELSKEEKIEVYKEWIEALRSNKYNQTRHALKVKTSNTECSYCCLGILCEIERERFELKEYEPKPIEQDPDDYSTYEQNYYYDETDYVVPIKARKLLGWKESNQTGETSLGINLADMNDRGDSFSDIANTIEQDYLKPLLENKDEKA